MRKKHKKTQTIENIQKEIPKKHITENTSHGAYIVWYVNNMRGNKMTVRQDRPWQLVRKQVHRETGCQAQQDVSYWQQQQQQPRHGREPVQEAAHHTPDTHLDTHRYTSVSLSVCLFLLLTYHHTLSKTVTRLGQLSLASLQGH